MASLPLTIRSHLARKLFIAPTSSCTRKWIPTLRRLSNAANAADRPKPKVSWLDLRGAGLSAVERLAIEELLLRHDPLERCWAIIGVHEPTENRMLNVALPPHDDWSSQRKRATDKLTDVYGHENEGLNRSCAIIMGIGGKAERLIDVESAKKDGVLVLKRFSGGGTVVVDHSSLWTTFIGRNAVLPHVKPFPREIMQWSADAIFGPAFESWNREIHATTGFRGSEKGRQTLVFKGTSCGLSGGVGESLILPPSTTKEFRQQQSTNSGHTLPTFRLRENDYVLGERKIGGNAQSIVSGGFLHHTSFLWDWDDMNMEYLTLPQKRPDYRGDRSHDEFLVRLKDHYGKHSAKNSLFGHVKIATNESFELEEMTLSEVLKIAHDKFGGLQEWFDGKCRTKVVKL